MRVVWVELIPHLPSFEAANEEVINIFHLGAERAARRRAELVSKASVVGGKTVAASQPVEDPAFKR